MLPEIDQPQPDAPVDRCGDHGVVEVGLGVVDRRIVRLHLGFELRDRRRLLIRLLLRSSVALSQFPVALQIDPGVGERRLVLRLLRHRLVVLGLVDGGIDARQHVALVHLLTLGEVDADQPPVHLRPHGHRIERLNVADAFTVDRDGLLPDGLDGHRDGAVDARCGAIAAALGRGRGILQPIPAGGRGAGKNGDRHYWTITHLHSSGGDGSPPQLSDGTFVSPSWLRHQGRGGVAGGSSQSPPRAWNRPAIACSLANRI